MPGGGEAQAEGGMIEWKRLQIMRLGEGADQALHVGNRAVWRHADRFRKRAIKPPTAFVINQLGRQTSR
jgi:hypothetical protein